MGSLQAVFLSSAGGVGRGVVVALLVVAVIAVFVYAACVLAGRRDLGALGAAVVAVVGGLLVLLDFV